MEMAIAASPSPTQLYQASHIYAKSPSTLKTSTSSSQMHSSTSPQSRRIAKPTSARRRAQSSSSSSSASSRSSHMKVFYDSQAQSGKRPSLNCFQADDHIVHTPKKPSEPMYEQARAIPTSPVKPDTPGGQDQRKSISSSSTISSSSSSSRASSHMSRRRGPGSSPKRSRGMQERSTILPEEYEHCSTSDLVLLISNMLLELIKHNDDIPLQEGRLTRFHSRAPPGISVKDYLQRLTTHATLSPPILLSMVYYIDRLCSLYPAFTISSLTVHRFLITAATVASKGLSDSFWTNSTYARVGGVSLKELALLELEFLWRVDWRIVPKPEVLVDYYRSLVARTDGFELAEEAPESGGPLDTPNGITPEIDSLSSDLPNAPSVAEPSLQAQTPPAQSEKIPSHTSSPAFESTRERSSSRKRRRAEESGRIDAGPP